MNERAIFDAALDITDVQARREYLEQACGGNAELRASVDRLLAAFESAGSFLQQPALEQIQASEPGTGEITSHYASALPVVDSSSESATKVPHDSANAAPSTGANTRGDEDGLSSEAASYPGGPSALNLLQPSSNPGSIGRFAHYEVLQVLGQGGFGTVFKAFDEQLHRLVAIKVLDPKMASTSPPRKRFLREARAAAAINHANIVLVYSVGESPLPYLVMEYVDGRTLQQKMDEEGPFPLPEALQIARQIASGLAAAHAMGLIHRDIKPSNILLDRSVQQRVKITDFGLARAADDASLTRTGVISGTPMYMAPEQARGGTLDHRADLFSFGSVLYQMLCGRPPFRASSTLAVMRRVIEDRPRPIREMCPEIPAWLTDVVEKLHAKEPEQRFQSAQEVADLLASFQQALLSQGVVARPSLAAAATPVPPSGAAQAKSSNAAERSPDAEAQTPAQTRAADAPTLAPAVAAPARRLSWQLALASLAVVAMCVMASEKLGVTRLTPFARDLVENSLPSGATPAGTPEATRGTESDVADATRETLSPSERESAPSPLSPTLVSSMALDALTRVAAEQLAAPLPATVEVVGVYGPSGIDWGGGIVEVFPSRDGEWWVIRGEDGVTHVLDRAGQRIGRFTTDLEWVRGVTSEGLLMTVGDRRLVFRDAKSGAERFAIPVDLSFLAPVPDQVAEAAAPALDPEGRFVATPSDDGSVTVWDARDGAKRQSVKTGERRPRTLALGPNGRLLATGDSEGVVRLWEVATGKTLGERRAHQGPVTALAFSANESHVASGGADRAVVLVPSSAASMESTPLAVLADQRAMNIAHVEFSPDSRKLLACVRSFDHSQQVIQVWNVESCQAESLGETPLACGARTAFARATFANGGQAVATAGAPGQRSVLVRELTSGAAKFGPPAIEEPSRGVQLSADGSRLAVSTNRGLEVWDTLERKSLFRYEHPARPNFLPDSLDLSADGSLVVFRTAEDWGTWHVGVVATGAIRSFEKVEGCEQRVAFSRDGKYLVGVGSQSIALWDVATRRVTQRTTWSDLGLESFRGGSVGLLRDNRTALVGGTGLRIVRIDLSSGRVERVFSSGNDTADDLWFQALTISADERLVASASSHPFTPVVQAWELQSGQPAWQFSSRAFGLEGAHHLQFSADGLSLAVSNRGAVELLDARTGRLVESQRLGPPDQGTHGNPRIFAASFTADGRYYATANGCGGAYLVRYR